MVGWDDGQYAEFAYWEQSALNSIVDHMNWRAIFPPGYTAGSGEKYPMIVMLHGAGESGRKFTDVYNYAPTDLEYDNNSHQLKNGGFPHMQAVQRDPSNPRSFPGIVMFPQVGYNAAWDEIDTRMLIGILEYMIREYSADPDRIAIHGLSNGAKGVWRAATQRPDLFAAVLSMSGVGTDLQAMTDSLATTPVWVFQGASDTNPSQDWSQQWTNAIISKGGEARYSVYNDEGHITWNNAYNEPDFFSWILSKDKKDIRFMGGEPESANCSLTAESPVQLGFSAGYLAYQWAKNGIPVVGATGRYYTPTTSGVYTVKFKRRTNNTWAESNPVDIFYSESNFTQFKPPLTASSSTDLPLPLADSVDYTLNLAAPIGFAAYSWYKNGVLIESNESSVYNLNDNTGQKFLPADAGSYSVLLTDNNGCSSLASIPVVVTFTEGGPGVSASAPHIYATSSTTLPLPVTTADKSLKLVANTGFAAYRWFKNGALLTESSTNELVLNNVAGDQFVPTNAGDYYVVVINASGKASLGSNTITITYLPAIAGGDRAITELIPYIHATSSPNLPLPASTADKSLKLVAEAGYAAYRWFKNGAMLTAGSASELVLNNVAGDKFVSANAGDYYVVVVNELGEESLGSNAITITYSPASEGIDPIVTELTPYLFATSSPNLPLPVSTADRSLKLVANAGFATYRWFKNDVLLMEGSTNELVLNNVAGDQFVPEDAGSYHVVVVNSSGILSKGSNTVTITYDPAEEGPDTSINEFTPHMYATSSTDLPLAPGTVDKSLSLVAPAGYTTYKWYKNNALVSEGAALSLTLNDAAGEMFVAENAGDYHVVVANEQGSSLPSNIIAVTYTQGAYNPPADLEKTILSSDEIVISWSDTGYEDAYEVYRARKNTFNEKNGELSGYPGTLYHFVATLPANTTTFVDSNLRPAASYNYKILAVQAGGGFFSEEIGPYVTTLADSSVPTTPQDLKVVNTTEAEIHLQWTPSTDNDVVFKYEVYLDGEKIADLLSESADGDPTDGSPEPPANFIVGDLESRKFYELKVRAVDYQGNNFAGNVSGFSNLVTSAVVLSIPGTGFIEEKALAYPNPFTHEIFLKLPDKITGELPVLLFNHSGNLIKVSATSGRGEEVSVDLSDVVDGLYILRVGNYNFRIIKRN